MRALMEIVGDARFAGRVLARSRGFTLVAGVTLALGIGATTAIFTIVDAVLLRPLDFPAPERLVVLRERTERGEALVSAPNFRDWRERSRSFEAMAAYRGGPSTVIGGSEPVRAQAVAVSGDYFQLLGTAARIGRVLMPEDDAQGAEPVAVVSDAFWRRYLGAQSDLSSLRLQIWSTLYTVVGVMPARFDHPEGTQIWFPIAPYNVAMGRTSHNDVSIARLRPGVTVEQARRELDAITNELAREHAGNIEARGAVVVPMQAEIVGSVRGWLVMLLGAVAFVLLVGCVNIASAGLARGAARSREMAVRTALGASRGRLVRQLLTEHVLLGLLGGAAGLVLARWLVTALLALRPAALPRATAIGFDERVLAFAVIVSVLSGVLVGILPALHVTRGGLRAAMSDGGRGTVGMGRGWTRRTLVAVEVALALVLVISAGLLIRSFRALLAERAGFETAGVLVADVSLPETKYPNGPSRAAFFATALEELDALPGAEATGLMNIVPLTRAGFGGLMEIHGQTEPRYADYRVVSPGYFAALRIPLLAGRMFDERDDSGSVHVTLVNRAMAERFWPGANPIGRRVRSMGMDQHSEIWMTVIGVVGDVRSGSLTREAEPQHFVHFRQRPERASSATLVVRGSSDRNALSSAVRARLARVDPDVPVELATMSDIVGRSVADRRFIMTVLAGFGGVSLLLAAIGVYGVLSYAVARRRQEIGVRLALGASRRSVVMMMLRESMLPIAAGVTGGALGALALTRLLQSLLYGVSRSDVVTFTWAAVLVTMAGVAASVFPAWRAARTDPLEALRAE